MEEEKTEYTVACSLERLVPDPLHRTKIQSAVERTHTATRHVHELLNIFIRRELSRSLDADLSCCFDRNKMLKAYYSVTSSSLGHPERNLVFDEIAEQLPPFTLTDRAGLSNIMLFAGGSTATVATTNIWKHFPARVLKYCAFRLRLSDQAYAALTKQERGEHRRRVKKIAIDVCSAPGSRRFVTSDEDVAQVALFRAVLRIDTAVGRWSGKPLKWHIMAKPHRFLASMYVMLRAFEEAGLRTFSLYPLRRSSTPGFIRFDKEVLLQLLSINKKRMVGEDDVSLKQRLFSKVFDLEAAGVHQRSRFAFSVMTDSVSARVLMKKPSSSPPSSTPSSFPHSIDNKKTGYFLANNVVSHDADKLHILGIDPGKHDIIHVSDIDGIGYNIKNTPSSGTLFWHFDFHPEDKFRTKDVESFRYTASQRSKQLCTKIYKREAEKTKPAALSAGELALADFNSRASSTDAFHAYLLHRRNNVDPFSTHYVKGGYRERKWKSFIKKQKSFMNVVRLIKSFKRDERPIVLAYGSWGMAAGVPGSVVNRGLPPTLGKGFMKELSKHFPVVVTPESYSSKTCCKCGQCTCGPSPSVESSMGRKIRGLRYCTTCGTHHSRDKNASINIGVNLYRSLKKLPSLLRPSEDADLDNAIHPTS